MKHTIRSPDWKCCFTLLILPCLLTVACSPETTPTPLPPTEVVQVPTDTPISPSDTPPPPTDTPVPSTDTPTPVPTPTLPPSPPPAMTAEHYLELGATLYDQGNLEEALAALDQAIALDPWSLEAYHYRHGVRLELEARQSLDELDDEIMGYDQAIAENEKDAKAYCQRGTAKYMRTVLSGEPADVEPLFDDTSNVTVVGGVPTSYRLNLEHAIAAVLSVPGATAQVSERQTITIDGNRGLVLLEAGGVAC